jgi:hypothetical protein
MMMHEYPVTRPKIAHGSAGCCDDADRFMAEDQRRFTADIPRHDVARTDPAGASLDQEIVRTNLWARGFFKANIAEVVKSRNLHLHRRTFCGSSGEVNFCGTCLSGGLVLVKVPTLAGSRRVSVAKSTN